MLKKSRKIPKAGDIFVCGFEGRTDYLWGRVVRSDSRLGDLGVGPSDIPLLHFYHVITDSIDQIPELPLDQLLIYPVGVSRRAWLDGCFMTIANRPLGEGDSLPLYRFRKRLVKKCLDEYGYEVPYDQCDGACGVWGLYGYDVVAEDLSEKLGLPLVPLG